MQHYTVTSDTDMLLDYALLASQSPITVSPPQGDPIFVTLTFIVSKPKASNNAIVTEINFTFPHGTSAYDLTADPIPESSASISTTGKEAWHIRQGIKPGMFTAKPTSDGPVTISDQSLTITFARLQINQVVGTADVIIVEVATTAAGGATPRKHTTHVPKFPSQFFVTGFSSTTPSVKNNERATLVWQGSAEAQYLMLWGDGKSENVSGKKVWVSPPLTITTTFMLQVTAQVAGESVTYRDTVTVTVANPNLVATDLRIGGTRLGYADPPNDREFVLRNDNGSPAFPGKNGGVTIGNRAGAVAISDTGAIRLGLTQPGSSMLVAADNRVGIGTSDPPLAKLQIADVNQDPKAGTLVLGPGNFTSGVTLRLGCQADYSWVQAHGAKPLAVNPIGNNVGIGTTTPQNALDVKGGLVIGSTYAGSKKAPSNGVLVEGDATIERQLVINGTMLVNGKNAMITSSDPDGQGIGVKGNLHATGRLVSWNPMDVYFPDKKSWFRMTISYNYGAWWEELHPSDIGLKEDIRPIHDALDKVKRLRGSVYRWNEEGLDFLTREVVDRVSAGPGSTDEEHEALRRAARQRAVAKLSGDRLGLIAQEVETVIPEAVSANEDGHKCVRYPELVALLVEAIKEQAAQIQALSGQVSSLAARSTSASTG